MNPKGLPLLLDHLDRGSVPLSWVIEHAPGGSLQHAWDACDNASVLMRTYALTGDRDLLVRAAFACSQTALGYIRKDDAKRFACMRAMEAIDRWLIGMIDSDEVRDACRGLWSQSGNHFNTHLSIEYTTFCIHAMNTREAGTDAGYAATYAAAAYADSFPYSDSRAAWNRRRKKLRDLAVLVRSILPCPPREAWMKHCADRAERGY